jgi:hypothetical protein
MRTMLDPSIVMRGDIVGDERQLDGSRHITLEFADGTGAWSCALSLIVDRDNRLREGTVDIDGPERNGSAALVRVLDLQIEPMLTLAAEISDTGESSIRWLLRLNPTAAAADSDDAFEVTFASIP